MEQNEGDIKELVGYLDNIKSYERDYLKSEGSTIGMLWGLFILIGGFLDLYVASILNYSPHAPVWFLVIAGAMISQQIISSQPLLYEETFTDEMKREKIPLWEVVLTVLIMALTIFVGNVNVAYVMPYIGFTFGTVNLITFYRNDNLGNMRQILLVSSFFMAAVLGLVVYLINPQFEFLSGFIFGFIVGGTVFLIAFRSRKELDSA